MGKSSGMCGNQLGMARGLGGGQLGRDELFRPRRGRVTRVSIRRGGHLWLGGVQWGGESSEMVLEAWAG